MISVKAGLKPKPTWSGITHTHTHSLRGLSGLYVFVRPNHAALTSTAAATCWTRNHALGQDAHASSST